jgi:hypothetical protein
MDTAKLVEFLSSLDETQKSALANILVTKEETKPKKRGRPKKEKEVVVEKQHQTVDPKDSQFFMGNNRFEGSDKKVRTGPRPNVFLEDEAFDAHKEDSELDKKLWKNKDVSRRGAKRTRLVTSICRGCGSEKQVNPAYVIAGDKGRYEHVCDGCKKRG